MLSARSSPVSTPVKKERIFNYTLPDHVKVGPFHVANEISDYTLANTVGRDKIPVIVYDVRHDPVTHTYEEVYGVLAPPTADVRMVCAGCYFRGMSLFHTWECMRCRTFASHFQRKDAKDPTSARVRPCRVLPEPLEAKMERMRNVPPTPETPKAPASSLLECDMITELRARPGGLTSLAPHIDDEDLVSEVKARPHVLNVILRGLPSDVFDVYCSRPPVTQIPTQQLIDVLETRFGNGLSGLLPFIPDIDIVHRALYVNPALAIDPHVVAPDLSSFSQDELLTELETRRANKKRPGLSAEIASVRLIGATYDQLEAEMRRICDDRLPKPQQFYNPNPNKRLKTGHVSDPQLINYNQFNRMLQEKVHPTKRASQDSQYSQGSLYGK